MNTSLRYSKSQSLKTKDLTSTFSNAIGTLGGYLITSLMILRLIMKIIAEKAMIKILASTLLTLNKVCTF